MRIKYYIIILLSTATYSCSTNSSLSGNEKAKIPEDVRKTLNDYHADVHRIGLPEELNYPDNSDDLYRDPPGYPSAVSFDSAAAVLKQNTPLYTSINNRWDTLRISILHHELASYTGRLHSTINDASRNVSVFRLVETGLLIKRKCGKHL